MAKNAEVDLPSVHDEASRSSQRAQSRFFKLMLAFLLLASAIALAGAFRWTVGGSFDLPFAPASAGIDVLGVFALVSLVGTLLVRRAFDVAEPQKAWYDGRAVAESVKSLAWRYAVGGAPFFRAPHPQARPPDALAPSYGQEAWYKDRSNQNAARARTWRRVSLGLEAVGVAVATSKAIGWLTDVDLLGIVATLLAAVAAWTNAKQHATLAESYAVAADDLLGVRRGIDAQHSEEAWAEFVANAEAAMSREHTVWRARRSVPTAA
jgi:SMODS and SLOG-associating 2TM effector domain 1/SMODS and SLOG-associating 2TM effector domain 3